MTNNLVYAKIMRELPASIANYRFYPGISWGSLIAKIDSQAIECNTSGKQIISDIRKSENYQLEVIEIIVDNYDSLETLDFKVESKFEALDTKLDTLIVSMHERNVDKNERWKMGGIIASCCIAVASFIFSIVK